MSQQIDNCSQANASHMEHQILDHVKRALRVTLSWKAPSVGLPRKISSVQFTTKSFQRHLERVMTLEEFDGYMCVVAECKPNLDAQLARLRDDHEEFRRRLAELSLRLESLNDYDATALEEACEEVRALLDDVDRHDKEEIDLLQESLLSDEGGEG